MKEILSHLSPLIAPLGFCHALYGRISCQKGTAVHNQVVIFVRGSDLFQAYIIGKSDEQYASIISQIYAMLFLATPHRGSANADFLNNILRTTPGLSAKTYVSELEKTSTSLQDINEQFRTICGNIRLVSFYENQRTNILFGVKKLVRRSMKVLLRLLMFVKIVDRESAVLGYPTETSSGLNADHHGICKFSDTSDPNYVQVRNALRMFVRAIKLPGT